MELLVGRVHGNLRLIATPPSPLPIKGRGALFAYAIQSTSQLMNLLRW